MGVSRVDYGGNTLIDLTNDSVSADTLAKGITAHNAAGEQVTGTMEAGTSVTKETITEALGYTPTKAWYVTFTIDDDNITADKTVAEIYQAYQDGYAVYGCVNDNYDLILEPHIISINTSLFMYAETGSNLVAYITLYWDINNSKWVNEQMIITSSSEGQSDSHLIVNVEIGDEDELDDTTGLYSVTSVDKTITEIYDAYTAGKIVIAILGNSKLLLTDCGGNYAVFVGPSMSISTGVSGIFGLKYYNGKWGWRGTVIPDETALVNKVLAALPTWTGGSY